MDHIDNIQIELPALSPAELSARGARRGESSAVVASRVAAAREVQPRRQGKTNRELDGREVDDVCRPTPDAEAILRAAGERFGWSARAHYRGLKVVRTIVDLAGADVPSVVSEAVQYRRALSVA